MVRVVDSDVIMYQLPVLSLVESSEYMANESGTKATISGQIPLQKRIAALERRLTAEAGS